MSSTAVRDALTGSPATALQAARPRWGERAIVGWLFLCAAFSVLVTVGIILALAGPAIEFFREVAPTEFF
jgi:phosphate transport system permease protein